MLRRKVSATEALKLWQQTCEDIQSQTIEKAQFFARKETRAEKRRRVDTLLKNYPAFVSYYFPHYCLNKATGGIIRAAGFHTQAANMIAADRNIAAVFMWARGHAKSTHMDIFIPMWLKARGELNLMVLVSKSQDMAQKLLGDLQAELVANQLYIDDFGEQYRHGSWEEGSFITKDDRAFFALGRGQSPRGIRHKESRPDYIVIDDIDDDELCRNPDRVKKVTEWVREALYGTFGASGGRFVMVGNLISHNSVLKNIALTEGVVVSRVNAYRKNGNISWPEFYTEAALLQKQQIMGYRAFQKEYMNNPITEGAVFKNTWIQWKKPLPLHKYVRMVAYCDPSFKSSSKNDYKAIKVWGMTGEGELHNLFAFVRQSSVSEMVRWFYDFHLSLPSNVVCEYYIEANFLQDMLLDEFQKEGERRGFQLAIRADRRKKPDKFQRIEAISPLFERGIVYFNEEEKNSADMRVALDQLLSFEKGSRAHDDAPDADEGAIYILQSEMRKTPFNPTTGKFKRHKLY